MKDFDIREIFCEVLGGGMFLLLVVGITDIGGLIDIKGHAAFIVRHITPATVSVVLVASYVVGLLVDAVGLAFGDSFLDDRISGRAVTRSASAEFWKTVPEHVLTYRNLQWTYYCTYRNILVLLVPGVVLFPILVYQATSGWWAAGVALLIAILMLCLWKSARTLLKLYYELGA